MHFFERLFVCLIVEPDMCHPARFIYCVALLHVLTCAFALPTLSDNFLFLRRCPSVSCERLCAPASVETLSNLCFISGIPYNLYQLQKYQCHMNVEVYNYNPSREVHKSVYVQRLEPYNGGRGAPGTTRSPSMSPVGTLDLMRRAGGSLSFILTKKSYLCSSCRFI